MSAGAPRGIWSASWFEPANWKRDDGEIFGKTSVSEAAA